MGEGAMIFTEVFGMLVDAAGRTARYVSSCGGTRSGKTVSMLQFLYLLACADTKPTVTSVVAETMPNLKRGAIRDFKLILGASFNPDWWSATESTYTLPNGSIIEFFSTDNIGRVHGPARDRLFINECQNIKYEVARQLFVRTRDYVYLDYNPVATFWVNERIEPMEECVTIHSTYLNNRDRRTGESTLSAAQIREIESNRTDANWWRVYGLGLTGQLEGLIYPDFEQIDAMPDAGGLTEVYGLDFGYTNDPTALVRVLLDTRKRIAYADEVIYERGMLNRDIIAAMNVHGIRRAVDIYADASEPKSIDEIKFAGYKCLPCYKGREVVEQIQFVKGWQLKVTKASVNMVRELRNYRWAQDASGRWLNEPEQGGAIKYDHILDAFRYAVFTKMGTFKKPLNGGKAKGGALW